MPCPTCDHTLAQIASVPEAVRVFHCERCGTAVVEFQVVRRQDTYVPKLVERCRQFRAAMTDGADACEFDRLGVTESIYPPDQRPQ